MKMVRMKTVKWYLENEKSMKKTDKVSPEVDSKDMLL